MRWLHRICGAAAGGMDSCACGRELDAITASVISEHGNTLAAFRRRRGGVVGEW
jgi:hypothetical protein